MLLSILLGFALAADVAKYTLLPGSVSPDGKAALCYRQLSSPYPSEHPCEFYICEPKTLAPLSAQLVNKTDSISDSAMFYEDLGEDAEAQRTGGTRDGAFNYKLVWSPDSHQLTVSGGMHKFWASFTYRKILGYFYLVRLPRARPAED